MFKCLNPSQVYGQFGKYLMKKSFVEEFYHFVVKSIARRDSKFCGLTIYASMHWYLTPLTIKSRISEKQCPQLFLKYYLYNQNCILVLSETTTKNRSRFSNEYNETLPVMQLRLRSGKVSLFLNAFKPLI